jgi:hypothetical protein
MRRRRSICAASRWCSNADQHSDQRPLDVGLQRDNGSREPRYSGALISVLEPS